MKRRVEVQDATAQLVSFALRPGSCSGSGCFQFEGIPLQEPSRAVSPDQRYAIIENDDYIDRYAYFLDDRHLNTRRELFTYNKPLFFLWNHDSKLFAVTGYTGSDVSRSTVVAVDEIVRPVAVLDLFARQLSEIEREDLEGRLASQNAKIIALAWVKPGDLQVEVSSYDDKSHAGFMQTYILPVDLHPTAMAPIWPK